MNVEDIWTDFLSKIKSKVSLMSYNYIFKDLKIHSYDDSKIIIIVPNNELLLQNITKNYNTLIEDTLNDITNDTCTIEYVFQKDIEKFTKKEKKPVIIEENIEDDFNDLKNYTYSSNFNPRHTFDTFIVGDSNKLMEQLLQSHKIQVNYIIHILYMLKVDLEKHILCMQ